MTLLIIASFYFYDFFIETRTASLIKSITTIENPRRQLKEFDPTTAKKATIKVLQKFSCFLSCGTSDHYFSSLPTGHELHIVDSIKLYCGTTTLDFRKKLSERDSEVYFDPFDSHATDGTKRKQILSEQRWIFMDMPYGVYWIAVKPCSFSGLTTSQVTSESFYGPYRIAKPLSKSIQRNANGTLTIQPLIPCPMDGWCVQYPSELGTYTPEGYDCIVDPKPLIPIHPSQERAYPNSFCIKFK